MVGDEAMHEYEVRIFDGKAVSTVLAVAYLSNNMAVSGAKRLAQGKPFEVWRGLDCVFTAVPAQRSVRHQTAQS